MPLGEAALREGKYTATVMTTVGDADKDLEATGLNVLPFDFVRSSTSKFSAIKLFWRLVRELRRERPDIIHFISLKPILLGGLAALFVPKAATVHHLTGLGYLADGNSLKAKIMRNISFRMLGLYLRRSKSWFITENSDDLAFARQYGAPENNRTSMFGGAGVDPDHFTEMPPAPDEKVHAGYVGRMIWSKGVDILVSAKEVLQNRGTNLQLDMYGTPDTANPRALQLKTMEQWNTRPGVKWHGPIKDVRDVWQHCEIAIVPTRTREGMPRAMLEAAACGRALIVTDVPGCREFVRDGIEGLIVPPDDESALADAMEKLVLDSDLRKRMGQAARQRILGGYTESHVKKDVLEIYATLLNDRPQRVFGEASGRRDNMKR